MILTDFSNITVTGMCNCGGTGCPEHCTKSFYQNMTEVIVYRSGKEIMRISGYSEPEEKISRQRQKLIKKAKQLGNAKQYGVVG